MVDNLYNLTKRTVKPSGEFYKVFENSYLSYKDLPPDHIKYMATDAYLTLILHKKICTRMGKPH